jgi:hypothetical protein
MISPLITKIVKQLEKENLSTEDRSALTSALLVKLNALPFKSAFFIEPNAVTIGGKRLDIEQTIAFRDSAIAFKDNYARKVLTEQVRYLAVQTGIRNGLTPDTIVFSKAALWCLEEMDNLLDTLV